MISSNLYAACRKLGGLLIYAHLSDGLGNRDAFVTGIWQRFASCVTTPLHFG